MATASETDIRQINDDDQFSLRVATSMVVACAFYIGSALPSVGTLWVPLLQWPAEMYSIGLLDLPKLLILALLIVKGSTAGVLLVGAVSVLFLWVAKYSGTGAFVPMAAFNLLFFASLLAHRQKEELSKQGAGFENTGKAAAILLAIIFTGAAFQKLNASYLAGNEFINQVGFLGPVIEYTGQSPTPVLAKFLAWSSLAIEFGIGVGALLWPRLAAHSAVIFCLVLSLVHPPVLFVYLILCPLLLLIDPEVLKGIPNGRYRNLVSNEFLWTTILLFGVTAFDWKNTTALVFFLRSGAIGLILLLFHAWRMWATASEINRYNLVFKGWRPTILTSLLLLALAATPIAAWLGAPAPIGFTMFSGRRSPSLEKGLTSHQVRIRDQAACEKVAAKIVTFSSTDGRFYFEKDSSCVISSPTESGLNFVLNRLCGEYLVSQSKLEIRGPGNFGWLSHKCPRKTEENKLNW